MATSSKAGGEAQQQAPGIKFMNILALALWLGGIHLNAILWIACFLFLPYRWALTALGVWCSSVFIPLFQDTWFANSVARFVAQHAPKHFPIKVHVEDMEAFDPNRSYVMATEPHSVLPIASIVLTTQYGLMPYRKAKALATSMIFWTPLLRHVWSWMGLVPASRSYFTKLLQDGYSVILIPGGVQEVLYLQSGQETIFLKNRRGFIRCAMEAGAPLVPCFCFGQSETYHYWKPSGSLYMRLSRAIGFTPLVFWGMYGSFIPYPRPMYFVVGRPIAVKKTSTPSAEEIGVIHETFMTAMAELFERHKSSAGYDNYTLTMK